MKCHFLTCFIAFCSLVSAAFAQGNATNVVLITLDGLRSEEVFTGADQRLMVKENGVEKPDELKAKYWRESPVDRRETLLPFLWKMCKSEQGWIAGDTYEHESKVIVSNGLFFSYPGYSELLCGFPDPKINSNDKKYNTNKTVLEWLNEQPEFSGQVAAFGSWDVFPFIINDKRSQVPVNAGWQKFTVGDPVRLETLNLVSEQLFHEWDGVRYDVLTTAGAIEYLKAKLPRVLFVSLGETDDWAHAGKYHRYLLTSNQNDYFVQQLWETCQSLPSHKDKTVFVVTSDHGRGDGREGWKNHGILLPGSNRIWVAAFGPSLREHGINKQGAYTQSQVAATVAALVGKDFTQTNPDIKPPLPFAR